MRRCQRLPEVTHSVDRRDPLTLPSKRVPARILQNRPEKPPLFQERPALRTRADLFLLRQLANLLSPSRCRRTGPDATAARGAILAGEGVSTSRGSVPSPTATRA